MRNIIHDWKINTDYSRYLNTDWFWFIDNISCPILVSMSWATSSWAIDTILYITGSTVFCSGSYNTNSVHIYFNSDSTELNDASYNSERISLINWIWDFTDTDSTRIDFSAYSQTWDLIDDDLNSDDYRWSSTWDINYPNNFLDNDDLARRTIIWYIPPMYWLRKVFWNNERNIEYIDWNTNNTWSLVSNIWKVSSWSLFLDIDKAYDIKVVEFDRYRYSSFNELYVLNSKVFSSSTWSIWYLQNDLSLLNSTWSAYSFDFKNKDYAIFVRSSWTWVILYKITGLDLDTNNPIYINTIDDSEENIIKYLWSDILINKDGQFISRFSEIFFSK